jgi:hypothetical protein
MTRVGRRATHALFVAAALTSTPACTLVARVTGPAWSERGSPLESGFEVADHRDKQRLRFLMFADAGTGKEDQGKTGRLMARECAERGGCDFALMAGDNVYLAGVRPSRGADDPRFAKRFEFPYADLGRLDMWAVPGNHDWYTRGSVDTEVRYTRSSARWRMPSHDYAVPGLPDWLRIYGLDTVKLSRGRDAAQLERARQALCSGDGWKLLFGHHPVYSSGKHADRRGEHPAVRDRLVAPLIEACGVHAYFAGHDHHQEHLTAPAFEQVVQGAGGKLRKVRRVRDRPAGVRSLYAASRFGFAIVEATPRRLEIRFFGYGRNEPYGELYCRVVDSSTFADPEGRLHPCSSGRQPD